MAALASVGIAAGLPSAAPAHAADGAPGLRCLAPTDAAGMDAMFGRTGSPLAGEGRVFVAEGVAAGIDPRALIAIAAHESGLALYPPARAIHNPFGLGPGIEFPSHAAAIARAARTLERYYVAEGRITLETIAPKWAPIGAANDPAGLNKNWPGGVSARYTTLGGDPDRPILIGAQDGSACDDAAGAAAAPSAEGASVSTATGWGSAALMLLLVLFLVHKRRQQSAAEAEWASRAARGRPAPAASPAALLAHAETAATLAPTAPLAPIDQYLEPWDPDPAPTEPAPPQDEPEASLWVRTRADVTDPAGPETLVWAAPTVAEAVEDLGAERQLVVQPEAEPEPEPVVEPEPAAETPVAPVPDYDLEAEILPELEILPVPAPEPEPEPEPIDLGALYEDAATVVDLVPAMLDRLVPFGSLCDQAEITPRMLTLMRILADTPLSVTDQAQELGLPRTVVAELNDRLEALGLAQRELIETDRRRIAMALTEAGYTLCADTAPTPDPGRVEAVLAEFSPAARADLLKVLRALTGPGR